MRRVSAQTNLMRQTLDFLFTTGDSLMVWGEPELVHREPGRIIDKPSLSIPQDMGQELMDALWVANYRPSNGQDSDATVDALKQHIKFAERVALGE